MFRGCLALACLLTVTTSARAAGPTVMPSVGAAVDAGPLVLRERPDLVPAGVTTRTVAESIVAATHPRHIRSAAYDIDTVCDKTYCVEELRIGSRVLIGQKSALAALRREVADPGRLADADATEVVLPQPSAPGFLSVYRVESDFTGGAAHARSALRCETYLTATGTRATLRDVFGSTLAARVVAAARRALAAARATGTSVPSGSSGTSFVVPAKDTVVFCGDAGSATLPNASVTVRVVP